MSTDDPEHRPDRWTRAIADVVAISRALGEVVGDQVRTEEAMYARSLRLLDEIAALFVHLERKIAELPPSGRGDRALASELETALTSLRLASAELEAGPAALLATVRQLDELQARLVALRGSPEEDLATLFRLLVRTAGTCMAITVQTRVTLETANLRAIGAAGRSVDLVVEALTARAIDELLLAQATSGG